MALSSGTGTGIFFIFAIGIVAFLIIWWAMATYAKQKRQRLAATNEPPSIPPHPHSRFGSDPVVRAEAGENTDGLPKYSAQARGDEQTVDRNATVVEMGRVGGFRPAWMSRPSMFRQATLPTQPPPAYDPAAPRAP
ncbi:hypothetical protein FRC08_018593 [Ceratobasidium sp. 394]|nr:hypothetical protein FRC08_018593 [Ceratobasidium sp. 394]KAG9089357.1 hypothetical protein FS749_001396 [Ceratobasidium sp. UAMH 11750]